jgi:hypothetical protein
MYDKITAQQLNVNVTCFVFFYMTEKLVYE